MLVNKQNIGMKLKELFTNKMVVYFLLFISFLLILRFFVSLSDVLSWNKITC